MSLEAGVLIDLDFEPIYWHLPEGRHAGGLPDSRALWDVIWEHKDRLLGFAHSHPGSGEPSPSHEDLTTFAAVESGLGERLLWWITSEDSFSEWSWVGPGELDYGKSIAMYELEWMPELRRLSNYRPWAKRF